MKTRRAELHTQNPSNRVYLYLSLEIIEIIAEKNSKILYQSYLYRSVICIRMHFCAGENEIVKKIHFSALFYVHLLISSQMKSIPRRAHYYSPQLTFFVCRTLVSVCLLFLYYTNMVHLYVVIYKCFKLILMSVIKIESIRNSYHKSTKPQ